jgi:hypothetical protein
MIAPIMAGVKPLGFWREIAISWRSINKTCAGHPAIDRR